MDILLLFLFVFSHQRDDFLLVDKLHIGLKARIAVDFFVGPDVGNRLCNQFHMVRTVNFGQQILILCLNPFAIHKRHIVILFPQRIPTVINIDQLIGPGIPLCLKGRGKGSMRRCLRRILCLIIRCQCVAVFRVFPGQILGCLLLRRCKCLRNLLIGLYRSCVLWLLHRTAASRCAQKQRRHCQGDASLPSLRAVLSHSASPFNHLPFGPVSLPFCSYGAITLLFISRNSFVILYY